MKKLCFVILFCLVTIVGLSYAEIIYVDMNNTTGPWDGTTEESAYMTIQEGINALRDVGDVGGEVRVAAGIYSPSTNGESFPIVILATTIDGVKLTNGIKLIGAGADVCILEAQAESGSKRVIRFDGGGSSTRVEGFTIRHSSLSNGGGILCKLGTSPIITNNIITGNNSGGPGGGIHCYKSSPTIKDNTITGNTTTTGGGGIACESYSSPTINNNIITWNDANISLDNWMLGGGGILCTGYSSPTITNNLISDNSVSDNFSTAKGGGIKCAQFSDATIINNIITDNNAYSSKGGGISSMDSSPVIINNTIASNTAYSNGGGIAFEGSHTSDSTITNNIITGNDSGVPGGGIYCHPSSPDITYNNVYNNTILDYSGCGAGDGCISFDPLFVAPVSGNYHLQSDSLCIDAGNNDALRTKDNPTIFLVDKDKDGQPRIVDADRNPDVTVDMGAYELPNSPPEAMNDSYSVNEDETLSVDAPGVLDNDDDDNRDELTAILVLYDGNGTLTLNEDGYFEYTPPAGFNGTEDTFTYMANDGQADSNEATVTITINHLPVAEDDDFYSVNEGDTLIVIAPGVLGNDEDPENDSLEAVLVSNVSNGTLTLNKEGSFEYTPLADFHGTTDTFTYMANDGQANSNEATVTITINRANNPPVAVNDDSYSVNEGDTLNVIAPGVLGNDEDPENDSLEAVPVSDVSNGTLNLSSDGSFTYEPDDRFHGTDTFTYKANDGQADSNVATVEITVKDQTPPTISLSDPILVSVGKKKGKGKGKKVNKLTVSATDNCSLDAEISIDINVEIFNKKGRPPKGKSVYYIIDGNDIYVFPKKKKWIICVTVTATDESDNSATEIFNEIKLLKSKGWSWKSFFKLLFWKCFH